LNPVDLKVMQKLFICFVMGRKNFTKAANVKTVSKVQEEKINTHFCKYQPLTAVVGEGSGENVSQIKKKL
jgi:hypothetical protein